MTKAEKAPERAPEFSVAGAFGLARDVFRARPLSVVRLVLLQALIFAALNTAQPWLTGYMARGFEDAANDPVALMQANAWISLFSLVSALIMVAAWAWLESFWLELFLRDRSPFKLDLGAFFRVFAATLTIYLIIVLATFVMTFAGMIVAIPLIMMAEVESDPSFALIAVMPLLVIVIPLLLFMLLVMSRMSALPALAVLRGGMPLGLAWRGAKGRVGRLVVAWSMWSVLYVGATAIFVVLIFVGPGPFADMFREMIDNPADPMAQYRAYADFSRSPGEIAGYWGVTVTANILFAALLMAARGIGVSLALDTLAREAVADEG
jgi:hypothetical protein